MGAVDILIHPPKDEKNIFIENSEKSNAYSQEISQDSIKISELLDLFKRGHFKDANFHEVLEKCEINFFTPPPEPRNAELEERILKLKAEQANAIYKSMTKNITAPNRDDLSIGNDIRSVTSQLTAVVNFVTAVAGSFFFAYKAVEYALPESNIPAQVMMGIITATLVALADLYFLARTI